MTLLKILSFPDARLRTVASHVSKIDERIIKIAHDMAQTMYDASGIGLAATQVDVHERLIVIDISQERDQLLTLINPEILWLSQEKRIGTEGCLSVPGLFDSVERAEKIKIRAFNLDKEEFELEAEDLLAVCIQHEMDHLLGKVFVEYLSPFKQMRFNTKLRKQARLAKNAK